MAEYTNNTLQTVPPGETVVFTLAPSPCERGLVRWRSGTGNFLLSGWIPRCINRNRCYCRRINSANYRVNFGANIAVPTGETVGEISLTITVDGATVPSSTMIVTPATVEEFFNVSREIDIDVWNGCCETVSVRNTSDIPILVQNPNIIFGRPDLAITY